MWELPHQFRAEPSPALLRDPKNIDRFFLVKQDIGPVAFGDNSQGLKDFTWELDWNSETTNWEFFRIDAPETTRVVGVTSQTSEEPEFSDITFDTAGRVQIVWETADGILLYWFDPALPGFTTTVIDSEGKNPLASLDYRDPRLNQLSDIIIIYEKNNAIFYRISGDRYTIEYPTPITDLGNKRLFRAGVGINLRYQIYLA